MRSFLMCPSTSVAGVLQAGLTGAHEPMVNGVALVIHIRLTLER